MRAKNNKIRFLLFLLLFPLVLSSQNFDKHKNVISGLNNYMEFIHETTHLQFLMRSDLMNFNGDLISRAKNPKVTVSFNNRDYLNAPNYYEQTPNEIYNICLNNKFQITDNENDSLNLHLNKMMKNIQNLQYTCDIIDGYVITKKYELDSNLLIGLSYLEIAKKEFDSYLKEWKLLVVTIENIASKYEIIDMNNPYIRATKHLDSLYDVVYKISESARINDTILVRNLLPELEYHITKLDGKEEFYLEGAKSYGRNNGKDPFARFASMIFDAKAELSYAKSFLKESKYPNYTEKNYCKPYYYYNSRFVNKFNRHGLGMGYEFNKFADNTDNLVLKKAQMPHTLKVIFPENIEKPEIIDVVKKDDYTLKEAPANNLVFLLDVSKSMNSGDKMPLLKESIKYLLTLMRDYDYVTIITYSGSAKLVLKSISASNIDSISKIVDKLSSSGGTKLYSGLKLAYKSANKSFIENGTNRIILATDGNFVITDKMEKIISTNSNKLVLSVLYFNEYEYLFENVQKLSELGKGNCTRITKENIKYALVKEARGE